MAPEPSEASSSASAPATTEKVSIPHRQKETFDKILLEEYVTRDWLHTAALAAQSKREKDILDRKVLEHEDYKAIRGQYRQNFPPAVLYGVGYNGYGNDHTDSKQGIMYPVQKSRPGRRRTPLLRVRRKDMAQQAEQVEELVPIRLDVDWDKIKFRDTFTWNIHDRVVPMELFAKQLVEDFGLEGLAHDRVLESVTSQIQEQMIDFFPPVYVEEDALDPELPYSAYKNDEMRILIRLNITIGTHTLVDQFEWEINNPLNSPEEFARCMSRDLSLSGEFTTAIAHCIREQSQLFTRSLYIIGHPFDGRPVEDADLVAAFLPSPIPTAFRTQQQAKDFVPSFWENAEADLERNEVVFSREQRRQKRSVNRRGGPTLPDLKDRQRTVRTLVVSSVLPGAAETLDESRLYKRVTGPGARGKRGKDIDFSESSDEEESQPGSPALSQLQGTARTRGMRGAANAASQRMANIARSTTPESMLHHHETRTSARRIGGREREDSLDGMPTLIVKLKIGKEKLRKLERDRRSGARPQPGHNRSHSNASGHGTPAPAGSMGPPSTPGVQNKQLGTASSSSAPTSARAYPPGQVGRVDAPPPPKAGQQPPTPVSLSHQLLSNSTNTVQPPPPNWLTKGLNTLHAKPAYAQDRFEGMMRYSAIDTRTDTPTAMPAPGSEIPSHLAFVYLPRIRCQDCPGKLYTPGPLMTVDNFEVHLKNRLHREKVEARKNAGN